MLTLAENERVLGTMARLTAPPRVMAADFYAILFQHAPEVQDWFADDISVQAEKFLDLLLTALQSLSHLDELDSSLRDLGRRHAAFGITERHYRVFGISLLTALSRHVADWNDADKQAWGRLYRFVATEMIRGAGQMRQHRAAAS